MATKNIITQILYISCVALLFTAAARADGKTTSTETLHSQRNPGQTDRVAVLMEVGGDFKEQVQGKQQRVPMSGVTRLVYHEKTLEAGNRPRAVRYYETAESAAKFKDSGHAPSLADRRRLVGVAVEPPAVTLFALRDPLRRDELEVIDILGNSLLLDELLPKDSVAIGDAWQPADNVVAALLGLEKTSLCDVQCTLKEVAKTVARVEFSGNVEGNVNDTKTRIELKGKYRFDLKNKRIDWFAMVIRENRDISQVAVGFDVTVRLQMTIAPEATPPELADKELAGLSLEPTEESRLLAYESPRDRWHIVHDRCWYLNSDDPGDAVLKMIRQGGLTAQCNIASLRRGEPNSLVSLEDFQEDVRKALGDSFGEFVEAKQMVDSENRRVLRVVAQGTAHDRKTEVPIQWIYYHVADEHGRQAALTFTIERELVERFAGADRPIVDSLQFPESDDGGPLAKADRNVQTKK